jgi:signal transduction histidine kinase
VRFSIYKKLLLGFAIVIVLMIASNVYVLWQLNSVTTTTSQTFRVDVRSINVAKQIQTILAEEERYTGKYMITGDTTYYPLYIEQTRLFGQQIDSLYNASPNNTEVGLLFRMRQVHTWLSNDMASDFPVIRQLPEAVRLQIDKARIDTLDVLFASLNQLIRSNEDEVSNSVSGISETMVQATSVAWLITVGALFVALAVALVITRTIVRPIRTLIQGTESIARGIFDPIAVSTHDEMAWLADAVNDMSNKLKQINDLKTEMMHHVSHELRTPLQTMLSAHYLLADQKRGPLNAEQQKLLGSIKEGIKKLTHFSNQFLDIQKIEHGSMEYTFVRSNLVDVITPAVDDALLIGAQRSINVQFTYETNLPAVMVDAEKMSQVFSNLLSNALKYTESDGTITVNVRSTTNGLCATVTDTGAGIPKDDVPRIFTKFYQAKNAKKGTGIGLALVRHLVEGHQGKVKVESELGKGTTFTVELPALPSNGSNTPVPRTAITEGTTS